MHHRVKVSSKKSTIRLWSVMRSFTIFKTDNGYPDFFLSVVTTHESSWFFGPPPGRPCVPHNSPSWKGMTLLFWCQNLHIRCNFGLKFKCVAMEFKHVVNIQIFLNKFKSIEKLTSKKRPYLFKKTCPSPPDWHPPTPVKEKMPTRCPSAHWTCARHVSSRSLFGHGRVLSLFDAHGSAMMF